MRKILLYIRVSTKEQEKKGFSLQTQEKVLRDYFKNDEIVKVIYDTTSGMKLERQGIEEMRKYLSQVDTLGAIHTDRLARDLKVLGVIEYWCNKENVKIITLDNKERNELVSDITAVVAKAENVKREEKISVTKEQCFQMGRHIAKPPLGYFYDKTTKPSVLRQNKDIILVKQIFKKRLAGEGYLKIAKELKIENKMGWPQPLTVRSILSNVFYIGYVRFKNRVKKGLHESAVSEEDFFKINGNEKWKRLMEIKMKTNKCCKCGKKLVVDERFSGKVVEDEDKNQYLICENCYEKTSV